MGKRGRGGGSIGEERGGGGKKERGGSIGGRRGEERGVGEDERAGGGKKERRGGCMRVSCTELYYHKLWLLSGCLASHANLQEN